MSKQRTTFWIVTSVIILGIFFQMWQFTHRQSFWKDETGLARNFLTHDLATIHEPFGGSQAAPIGFLQISKLHEMALGHNEHVFWLLPLFLGIIGIFVATHTWKNLLPLGAWVMAVGLWAFNPTMIVNITQFKPYLTDAVVTLVLTWAFFYYREGGKSGPLVYLLAGLWALWMSYTSVFVLAGFGLWMIIESIRFTTRQKVSRCVAINFILGAVFALLWVSTYSHLDADGGFQKFWALNFVPLPWAAGGLRWWCETFGSVFGYIFGQTQWLTWVLLCGLGIAFAIRHNRRLLVLLVPVLLTICASLLRLYPIHDRLEIFWTPLLTPFVALGIYAIWRQAKESPRAVAWVLVLCVALPYLYPLRALPGMKDPQELKQVTVIIQKKAQAGDIVYIHARANELYKYYFARYPLAPGVTLVYGEKAEAEDLYSYLKKHFAGRHVWVLFAEPFYDPSELSDVVRQADARKEMVGMGDFSMAGAFELRLQ